MIRNSRLCLWFAETWQLYNVGRKYHFTSWGDKRALFDWLRHLIISVKNSGWALPWHARVDAGNSINTGFGLAEYNAWLSHRLKALENGTTALGQQLDLAIETVSGAQHEPMGNSQTRILIGALCQQISLNARQVSRIHAMQHLPSRWHGKTTVRLQKLADVLELPHIIELAKKPDQAEANEIPANAVRALNHADVDPARTTLLALLKQCDDQLTDPVRGDIYYALGLVAVLEMNLQDACHYFDRAVQYAPDDVENLHCAAKFADLAGDRVLAEKHARSGIALTGSNVPSCADRLAGFQFSLAGMLEQNGQPEEAADLYHAALNGQLGILGADSLAIARSYSAIASNLDKRGRHREAGPIHQKAQDVISSANGGDSHDSALIIEQMAICLSASGQNDDASAMFEEALEMHQSIYDGDTPERIVCFGSAAHSHKAAGQDVAAGNLYRRALDGSLLVFGLNHPQTARCHDDLAGLLSSLGDHESAEQHYCLALEIHQNVSGSIDIATAQGLGCVARCLEFRNELEAAEALLLQSLMVFEQIGDDGRAGITGASDALAKNLIKQGRVCEAGPHMERALAHARAMHGEEHPETRRLLAYLSEFS